MARTPLQLQIFTLAATAATGFILDRAVRAAWSRGTGRSAPREDDLLDTPVVQVIAFAALSGAVATVAQQLVTRQVMVRAARRGILPTPDAASEALSIEV